MNPDLLPPGGKQLGVTAPPAITSALPATEADATKYYACSLATASFFRKDGKKIAFVNGFVETKVMYDQEYLDEEIKHGNPYLRAATAEEVRAFRMAVDPKETLRAELKAEMEAELREKITQELAAAAGKTVLGATSSASLAALAKKG